MADFHDRLRAAGQDARPAHETGLGARLVRRGRLRRRRQTAAAAMGVVAIVAGGIAVADLARPGGVPVVTGIEETPTPTPTPAPASTDAPSATDAAETPTVEATLPPLPTPSPSASVSPSASPSPSDTGSSTGGVAPDDVGITADTVTITVVDHSSGVVPQRDAATQAVQAYLAWFEQEVGTIDGRHLEMIVREGLQDAGATRRAYQDACEDSFAVVGMAVPGTLGGRAGAIEASRCGLPDVRAQIDSEVEALSGTTVAIRANNPLEPALAHWAHWAARDPAAIRRAGWIASDDAESSRYADEAQALTEDELGYDWVVDHRLGPAATNFGAVVAEMIANEVEFVHIDTDPVQAVRLAQAMQQSGYEPTLVTLGDLVYQPATPSAAGGALDGAEYALDSVPLHEFGDSPSARRYRDWLRRVHPEAEPTIVGLHAWAATELFVDGLRAVGPNPTREALLDHLDAVRDFTARGLVAPRRVALGRQAACFAILAVRDQGWVRVDDGRPGTMTTC